MRRATSLKSSFGAQVSQNYTFPAPVGGMNTRDPVNMLPLTESPYMRDCYPSSAGIVGRYGTTTHATGLPARVRSFMPYVTQSGTETLFGASGTGFYNITSAGAVGAAVVTGLTNSYWQSINFTISGGTSYLCCFNGVDSPRYWDGASWITVTGVSTPAITGLTTSTIVSAFTHQRRMWLVAVNSLTVWYLPTDSVGGAANPLYLGGVATKGGYVVAGNTWTMDGGDGVDDYWVVVTSSGQMIAYRGTDPSSASTWGHVGTWNIPIPYGRQCLYKYRGDLLVITTAGILSAREVMSGNTTQSAMITHKITPTYLASIDQAVVPHLAEDDSNDLLLFCASKDDDILPMNRSTGAWGGGFSIFASAIVYYSSNIHFSSQLSNSTTYRFASNSTDSTTFQLLTASSDLGLPGIVKSVKLARISGFLANNSLSIGVNVSVDTDATTIPTQVSETSSIRGYTNWHHVGGAGTNFAVFVYITSTFTKRVASIQLIYESGGLFGATPLT